MNSCKLFYTVLCLLVSITLNAQLKVTGTIKTSDDKPVEFVNVFLTNGSSSAINGTITETNGSFKLLANKNTYKLTVSSVGFETYTADVVVDKDVDLGNIVLKADAQQLEAAVVTGKLIERKSDRFVMNVQGNPVASGKNTVQMLEMAPSVWVDKQQGISINGKTDIRVMINDRLVNMSNDELVKYLETINAEDIQSIEIITSPGVEYEANTTGGILHIKLKKGRVGGLNGSVAMNYSFTKDYHNYKPSVNLNYRKDKLSLYGSFLYRTGPWYGNSKSTTYYPGSDTVRYSEEKSRYDEKYYIRGMFGTVYELSDNQEIGATFEYRGMNENSPITIYNERVNGDWSAKDMTYRESDFSFDRFDASVNYKLKLDTIGSNLKAFFDFTRNNRENIGVNQFYRTNLTSPDSMYRTIFPADYDVYVFRVDYLKKFNENTSIMFGGRYNLSDMNYKSKHDEWRHNQWEENTAYTDNYDYRENVAALYGKFDSKWKNLAYTLGLRYENTRLNISDDHKPTYNDIFPSVFLKYNFNETKGHSLSGNFNRKLTRPYYTALNPFKRPIDSYSYEVGNPGLEPTYVNTYELGATFFDKYIFTVQYSVHTDVVNYITKAAPESGMTMYTSENLDKMKSFYISLYAPVKVASWYNFTIGGNLSNRKYESQTVNNQKWVIRGNTQHTFTLPKGFTLGVSAWAASAGMYGNQEYDAMGGINGSISKKFFDNKLVAAVNVWNIQGERTLDITYRADDYLRYLNVVNQYQVFDFTLTYNFNLGNKKVKVSKVEKANEDDRMQ